MTRESKSECACFATVHWDEGVGGADLDSSAVLVAGHAVDLVHDQDVFAAHRLRRTCSDTRRDEPPGVGKQAKV